MWRESGGVVGSGGMPASFPVLVLILMVDVEGACEAAALGTCAGEKQVVDAFFCACVPVRGLEIGPLKVLLLSERCCSSVGESEEQ